MAPYEVLLGIPPSLFRLRRFSGFSWLDFKNNSFFVGIWAGSGFEMIGDRGLGGVVSLVGLSFVRGYGS